MNRTMGVRLTRMLIQVLKRKTNVNQVEERTKLKKKFFDNT